MNKVVFILVSLIIGITTAFGQQVTHGTSPQKYVIVTNTPWPYTYFHLNSSTGEFYPVVWDENAKKTKILPLENCPNEDPEQSYYGRFELYPAIAGMSKAMFLIDHKSGNLWQVSLNNSNTKATIHKIDIPISR